MIDNRLLKKIFDLIRNASATRVVLARIDDAAKMQAHQVTGLDGEQVERAEYFQPYGFTSVPPAGSEAVALPVGGDRGHLIVLGAGDRGRRKKGLKELDVAVYHANGDFIVFKDGNEIETSTKKALVNAEDEVVTNTKKAELNAEDEVATNTKKAITTAEDEAITDTKKFEARATETALVSGLAAASLESAAQASIRAPQIGFQGRITAAGPNGEASPSHFIGDMNIQGSLVVTGSITAGSVTAGGDIVAGGVSLKNHTHKNVEPGNGNSGPPN